ncbi:hypothetical protein [Roseobacter litoralis]|uniref:Uncharacterized protein n=1 Tax=Roseobacter litoralis (strain ATCC 49566 / DSM 6996 / JCM 21268 / NBRC 15278 / OCh 149) TaxID=391595 RepID=F7ZAP9_ROSLO|nr:hypothetical protein [Roseobacter litoralis]AEI94245.1 hypothetical protein RLO149_c022720 [Roseobacter litoralis Och 149]
MSSTMTDARAAAEIEIAHDILNRHWDSGALIGIRVHQYDGIMLEWQGAHYANRATQKAA